MSAIGAGGVGEVVDTPLLAKIATVVDLSGEDRAALAGLVREARETPARRSIIREGDRPEKVHLILDGWAARYKLLPDGARQITAFLLPGDFCDLHTAVLGEMDHSIITLTAATVAYITRAELDAVSERPRIARALLWSTLVDEAILRAWIVNVGRRDAEQAIGHLICELYVRMRNVGLTFDHSFDLPLTQEEIADALGLTPVHVNRIVQRMRAAGTITLKRGLLTIEDYRALESSCGFNPNYLHIARREARG